MKYFLLTALLLQCLPGKTQNIGIGTTEPKARLHVADSNVIFTATGGVPGTNGALQPTGSGRRFMWYAHKAALRAGYAYGSNWDDANIGLYSIALGHGPKASGLRAVALGDHTVASGPVSTALGYYTEAIGNSSVAMGSATTAYGAFSTAIGQYSYAGGAGSFAGGGAEAHDSLNFAFGKEATARENYSFAVGYSAKASGKNSFAFQTGESTGNYSFAAGKTTARVYMQTVFGQYNLLGNYISPYEWNGADQLFVIGNGTTHTTRSNALTILKRGDIGINTAEPDMRLCVNGNASKTGGGVWLTSSDARLKKNINPYTKGLKEILQINPVTFQYNELSKQEDQTSVFTGVLAQEIEKILPSTIIIKKDDKIEDKRMFDGSELIYTLINAVKEQQQKIEALEKKILLLENK